MKSKKKLALVLWAAMFASTACVPTAFASLGDEKLDELSASILAVSGSVEKLQAFARESVTFTSFSAQRAKELGTSFKKQWFRFRDAELKCHLGGSLNGATTTKVFAFAREFPVRREKLIRQIRELEPLFRVLQDTYKELAGISFPDCLKGLGHQDTLGSAVANELQQLFEARKMPMAQIQVCDNLTVASNELMDALEQFVAAICPRLGRTGKPLDEQEAARLSQAFQAAEDSLKAAESEIPQTWLSDPEVGRKRCLTSMNYGKFLQEAAWKVPVAGKVTDYAREKKLIRQSPSLLTGAAAQRQQTEERFAAQVEVKERLRAGFSKKDVATLAVSALSEKELVAAALDAGIGPYLSCSEQELRAGAEHKERPVRRSGNEPAAGDVVKLAWLRKLGLPPNVSIFFC
ncbi:hypothetical protein FACS1894198_3310 [Clostridia bacterium]|nr:hypothetical protein FACS1894198_3310 [Clostridia bacterium]